MENLVEIGLYIAYAMIVIGGVGAILLPLIKSLGEPQKLLKGLVAVIVLAVVFGLSWALAGGEVIPMYVESGVDSTKSKMIGGALTMVYFLGGIALVGIVFTEVTKVFK